MPGIIPPRSDLLFKRIFGDPRNIDILTAFLKAVLPIVRAWYGFDVFHRHGDQHT